MVNESKQRLLRQILQII